MANSYPTAIRSPNARGLGTFTVPRAANDNVRQYVHFGSSPIRLVPANDNPPRRALVGVTRGLWRAAWHNAVSDIALNAVQVVSSIGRYEKTVEVPWASPPAVNPSQAVWQDWNTLVSQCAVPTDGQFSAVGGNNCSANVGAPVSGYPTYSQVFVGGAWTWTWEYDVREFLSPAAGWRFRQRYRFRLREQPNSGTWWWDHVPDPFVPFEQVPVGAPVYRPAILPAPFPRAVPTPKRAPDWRWQGPSAGPRSVATVPPARPPGPNVRERKMIVAIHGVPARLINFATETLDFVDAIHGALPKELQARPRFVDGRWVPPSPVDKAMAVYNHLDRLDLRQALINLLLEQFEDAVYGGIGSLSRRSLRGNRYYRRPVGWQTGPAF